MAALVEGFGPDALALARFLAMGGDHTTIRVAGSGPPPPDALALRELGVVVEGDVDLDQDPGAPDIAYLDVWTPEVAPRVMRLRERGARLSCIADVVLERSPVPTVGITGTAGKTTTAAFTIQLLRRAGLQVAASASGRAGNVWASADNLRALADASVEVSVLELTSSELAFCSSSPQVAAITCFWPDHIELHGSLDAYRAAKQRIVAAQRPGDRVVLNADDAAVLALCSDRPATARFFSTRTSVEDGAFLDEDGRIVASVDGHTVRLGNRPGGPVGLTQAVVAATAIAVAVGVDPHRLVGVIEELRAPPFRATVVARRDSTALIDDGMAATPTKTAAALSAYPPGSVVGVLGGTRVLAGLEVHSSPEERRLFDEACDLAARVLRAAFVFGEAGELVADALVARGVAVVRVETLSDAIDAAGAACTGADALVVSPMFPVALDLRLAIAGRLAALAR